jgi:putative transposase
VSRAGRALAGGRARHERRACQVSGIARSTLRYRPVARDESVVITFIQADMALNPRHGFGLLYDIQPSKPTQNAYVERLNKTYRTEALDCYVFDSLQEVRDMTADWLHRYNHHRPHEALGRIPPVEYLVKLFPNTPRSEGRGKLLCA